jgi:DNA-binding response OmpR family regulator
MTRELAYKLTAFRWNIYAAWSGALKAESARAIRAKINALRDICEGLIAWGAESREATTLDPLWNAYHDAFDSLWREGAHIRPPKTIAQDEADSVVFGLQLDLKSRTAKRKGKNVEFGAAETLWNILVLLFKHHPTPMSDEAIKRVCLDKPSRESIYNNMSKLNKKLGPLGVTTRNTRGVGYKLERKGRARKVLDKR